MQTYKASDFARNPEKVYESAKRKPVKVDRCRTSGDVKDSFILISQKQFERLLLEG